MLTPWSLFACFAVHAASYPVRQQQYIPHGIGCTIPGTASRTFCNPLAPLDDRIKDFLSGLSVDEKILLTGAAGGDVCSVVDGGAARYGVPNVTQLIEVTGAVSSDCYYDSQGASYCPTVFPAPLSMAASFNRTLWRLRGAVTGQEARAFNNLHVKRIYGVPVDLLAYGPDENVIMDPRNGRNGENPSEDGFLTGEYSVEYIKGAQEGEDPKYLQLALGVKHYAVYQTETNRFASNANVTTFDLLDTYLVPYEASFVRGGAMGSMCSYNSINFAPSCANHWLLTSMVRDFWGRPDAFTLSDCGAIESQVTGHHTAVNISDACTQSIRAGTDGCAGSGYIVDGGLAQALAADGPGGLSEGDLDAALTRTLTQRFKLGMFDPPTSTPYTTYGPERIHTPQSAAAAEGAAAQGSVLLRNQGGVLPLNASMPSLKRIAVVGPHANSQRGLLGDFYGDAFCPGANTPSSRAQGCVPTLGGSVLAYLGGLGRADVEVTIAQGVGIIDPSTEGIPDALAAVSAADVVFLAVGYSNAEVEREGSDHNYTGFPGIQGGFITQVLAAAGSSKPVIMILVHAGQIALDSIPALPPVVIDAFYPAFGMPALVSQVFGGRNEWGRLPYTLYEANFATTTALSDASVSGGVGGGATRTYRYYKGHPTHWFGEGMSYANFALACDTPTTTTFLTSANFSLPLTCTSTLTGGWGQGDQVLLVYHSVGSDVVGGVGGAHPVPFKTLREFDRVTCMEGGGGGVSSGWELGPRKLALVNENGASVLYPGTHTITVSGFGGATFAFNVTLTGAPFTISAPPVPP